MRLRPLLAIALALFCTATFATSEHPDLMIYERLGSPSLFQKRINFSFMRVSLNASVIPTTLKLIEMKMKLENRKFEDPDKKAALCVLMGMIGQQIASEVKKYTASSLGWATRDQRVAGETIFRKADEAMAFCGLTGIIEENPATTIEEALERMKEIGDIAGSIK